MPGETIQIKNSKIYVNGKVIKDKYAKDKKFESFNASKKIKLGKDEYFVLGDNRINSHDSRYKDCGNIKIDTIVGKVIFNFK